MRYDSLAPDGQRVIVTLVQTEGRPIDIRMPAWDWEVVPLARFVGSATDSAFSFFGELPEGAKRTLANSSVVSYHPALQNTLMGLRLMQLDLFLFQPPFTGYFTDAAGSAILGAGERIVFGNDVSPTDPVALKRLRAIVESRVDTAMGFLLEDCKKSPSRTCLESDQPFASYIVGDMISPVSFTVQNGSLAFRDRGVCWDFSREADPGERASPSLPGIRLLRPLSETFCDKVVSEWQGIHPLVYRAARRAMRFSALLRHHKAQDSVGYGSFVQSMRGTTLKPSVSTPTEVAIKSTISVEESERLRRAFERLRRQRK
jgi:hypothetical protein